MKIPIWGSIRRFKQHYQGFAEHAGYYCPGGYHPVTLGDVLEDGRYTITAKLGHGGSSTVWLAKQNGHHSPPYVALKILRAKDSECTALKEMHAMIDKDAESPRYIVALLDEFYVEGPNGVHQCLTFELMGHNFNILLQNIQGEEFFVAGSSTSKAILQAVFSQKIVHKTLWGILKGLSILHKCGIVHADLNQGNILAALNPDTSLLAKDSVSQALLRKDGKKDKWAPGHLYGGPDPRIPLIVDHTFHVKVADLGSAYWVTSPPAESKSPPALSSPGTLLGYQEGTAADIWSFGCLVFEFAYSGPLFSPMLGRDLSHLLLQILDSLGPFPERLLDRWASKEAERDEWFNTDSNTLLDKWINVPADKKVPPLEVTMVNARPEWMSDEELVATTSLIRACLNYDPIKRPTAAELLHHPYFQAIAQETGQF